MEEVFPHTHLPIFSWNTHGPVAALLPNLMEEVTHGRVEVEVEGPQLML